MNEFEKEWQNYFKDKGDIATINIKELAKHFAKWQKEETINKACEWWIEDLLYPSMTQEEHKWVKSKVNAFRRAMKGGEE